MIYEMKCRFCSLVTGTIEFKSYQPMPKDMEDQFLDIRCSSCEQLYGVIKDMEQAFLSKGVDKKFTFKDILKKTQYKKDKFDKELEKLVEKLSK